jgi:hypothetical protein
MGEIITHSGNSLMEVVYEDKVIEKAEKESG